MQDHENEPDETDRDTGAEDDGAQDAPPIKPASDDDSPLGDTDQHSTSDA